MARQIAFKVFGKLTFQVAGQPAQAFGEGCIEIFIEDAAKRYVGLCWRPKDSVSLPNPEPPRFPNLTAAELVKALGDGKTPVEFRLDAEPGKKLTKVRLYCRGAALLQEFVGSEARPHLSLPVLANYKWQGGPFQSEVVFGDKDDDPDGASFTFRLALWTPRPQSGRDDKLTYAFPITVRYDPKPPTDNQRWLIHYAGAGPEGTSKSEPTDLDSAKEIGRRALGEFGFSRTDGGSDFLHWPRKATKGDRDKFWPVDTRAFVAQVIKGFCVPHRKFAEHVTLESPKELREPPPGNREEVTAYGHRWNSIGFSAEASGHASGGLTIINYRSTLFVAADAGTTEKSGDLIVAKDAVSGSRFLIRDPSNPVRWVDTQSSTLFLDLEVRYPEPIDPWELVKDINAAKPSITLRLGYDAEIESGDVEGLSVTRGTVTISQRLSDAIRGSRRARLDVENIHATEPQSFAPEIRLRPAVSAIYRMSFTGELARAAEPGAPGGWKGHALRRIHWPGIELHYSLWPEDRPRFIGGEDQEFNRLPADVAFPGFRDDPNGWIPVTLAYHPFDGDYFGSFAIQPRDGNHQPITLRGRLGGLELEISTKLPSTPKSKNEGGSPDERRQPELLEVETSNTWFFGSRKQSPDYPADKSSIAASEQRFKVRLDVNSVVPRGADVDERLDRPRPILIDASGDAADADRTAAAPYALEIDERCTWCEDRRLLARLYVNQNASAQAKRYVLLADQPFSIVRFTSRPAREYVTQQDQAFAVYDSDSRRWQFKLIDEQFHYELQAQAVGESMDRPERLEISDPDGPNPPPPDSFFPPYDPSEAEGGKPGLLRRRAIEFRLTPSTELWIRASDLKRNFYLPEWATRQLFRDFGPLGLGASLRGLRGEFLYGMPVSVDPELENGPARTARVAEIEALLGTILGELDVTEKELDKRWKQVCKAVSSRPERLELWMRDASASTPLVPARFDKGTQYALRDTAIYRSPFGDDEAALALTDDSAASGSPDKLFRFAKYGLPGGAIWPLESINFCRRLRESPESSGGTIEKIGLSPMGGDADQRAEFLNGQVAIISETRNGFVQRHRIEIIGRISVFWHRAKHVVVYERTTSPSAQFTPVREKSSARKKEPTRSRRPILRKVSEYIELLQPVRSYPDMAAAGASSAGFLRSVRFNSTKINVDSAWSEELGDYGWRIPLWDRGSARQRPSVYPRPDIAFVTSAEGDEDDPLVAQECLDPDNIYFFAEALPGTTADTDTWAARAGLDYANLPEPNAEQQPGLKGGENDRKEPSAPRIPRGHRPYTWRLGPTARKTAINAGFGAEPLFAALETITFMRATRPSSDDAAGAAIAKAMTAMNGIAADVPEAVENAVVSASAALDAALKAGDGDAAANAAQELAARLQALGEKVQDYAKAIAKPPNGAGKPFHQVLGLSSGGCEKIVSDFSASIQRRKLLFVSQIQDWVAEQRARLPSAPTYDDFVKKAVEDARRAIEASLPDAKEHVDRADRALQQAFDCIRDFEADVVRTLDKALADVARVEAEYDKQKPWSPARIEEYHRRITEVRDGVVGDLTTAVTEIQTRLATELDSIANGIMIAVGTELRRALAAKDGLLSTIRTTENAASGLLLTIAAKLDDPVAVRIAKLRSKIEEVAARDDPPKYDHVFKALRSALEKLEKTLATAEAAVRKAADRAETTAQELLKGVELAAGELKQFADQVTKTVADLRTEAGKIADGDLDNGKSQLLAVIATVEQAARAPVDFLADQGQWADQLVRRLVEQLRTTRDHAEDIAKEAVKEANTALGEIRDKLSDFRDAIAPDKIADLVQNIVIEPGIKLAIPREDYDRIKVELAEWQSRLDALLRIIEERIDEFDSHATSALGEVEVLAKKACGELQTGLDAIVSSVSALANDVAGWATPLADALIKAGKDLDKLRQLSQSLGADWETQRRQFEESYAHVTAYADRVFDEAGKLTSGGLAAAPSNILRLYAAAASAPALPNLDFARERLGYYYSELNKVIDTTPVEAWFGRLGDELKAMGLSVPFSKIGDGIIPKDLSKFDIGRIFRNFGGLDLSRLFSGHKLPPGAKDAIKITHAFDKKLFRAWVQVDVDLPIPGRKSLFAIGPFQLDLVDSRLVGLLRLEASKDTDRVEQTGRASLNTNIDAVVSGQSMVMLQKVSVKYERGSGLDVEFDPKNIRLNPAFRFLQETLAKLFPEELGGLKVIKKDGVPVGIEHEFTMPPISLMGGTSGVSNIQISNNFGLIAYPDFMISNRFALSKPEMPFIFSIFVIGGTGYVTVDCFYRPFNEELTVIVEAAAGGSAALGFAIGPVSGSVFITLSIALKYRKTPGQSGALTASLVLLIAGNVDVAGVATVYIALLLRMAYHENGQIDGVGTLSVTVRISRFFKIKVRRQVNFKLRSATSSRGALLEGGSAEDQARRLIEARG